MSAERKHASEMEKNIDCLCEGGSERTSSLGPSENCMRSQTEEGEKKEAKEKEKEEEERKADRKRKEGKRCQ
jgi:ribosomal protein L12E/L44/L45/RPP1/RPP2